MMNDLVSLSETSNPDNPAVNNPAVAYEQRFVPMLFRPWAKVLLDRADLQASEHVLDVACGTGIVARMAAPLVGESGYVAALDINPAMLEVARSAAVSDGVTIDWREGSALLLPFDNTRFDVVLCQQGIQFFPDVPQALDEMWRVLQPGGRVLLSVHQSLPENPVYARLNEVFVHHLGSPALAGPFSWDNSQPLEALLNRAGFRDCLVEVVQLPVNASRVEDFIRATVLASGVVVPALAQLDSAAQADLIEHISDEMRAVLAPYVTNSGLSFSVNAWIARATA